MDHKMCEMLQEKILRNEITVFFFTTKGWILKWDGKTLLIKGKKYPHLCRQYKDGGIIEDIILDSETYSKVVIQYKGDGPIQLSDMIK